MDSETNNNQPVEIEGKTEPEEMEKSDIKLDKEDASDDADFIWDEYLEESGSIAAPPTLFFHVEQSLQSCFTVGMKLEVPNREQTDKYWVASVVMTCGPLLRLRYEGFGDDKSADFWCDIATNEVHPVGWCLQNERTLEPPSAITSKLGDWKEFLSNAMVGSVTIPTYVLEANGTNPIDLIKQGMKIEVQGKLNPTCVWIATVLENVGGRLLLRYDGANSSDDFWLFYLSHRLHPVGWAIPQKYKYKPPDSIASRRTPEEWVEFLQQSLEEAKGSPLLREIFKLQEIVIPHEFKVGTKLESVNPTTLVQFCPSTVSKVLDKEYFLIQIDDHGMVDKQPQEMCCHRDSCLIFPVGWAKANDLSVMHSKGWMNQKPDFDWVEYLQYCRAEATPESCFNLPTVEHGFEKGMKLEAVNPFQPNQICAATITKVVKHLLWIQLDSIDSFHPNHIVPYNSHDIFPVGWCESNHYPLKPPLHVQQGKGKLVMKVPIFIQDKQKKSEKSEGSSQDAKAWCPKIYFNHRCFTGPYLSNGRIAQLPRHVGPGPVVLVLKEVLSKLINVAYKSSKVLQELEMKGKHNPNMQQCVLKAKYKGKCHRRVVEVLRNSEHVKDFCREICLKLDCCPYLFGPKHVGDNCPHQCSNLSKTKYIASKTYTRKRRRLGRPPLANKKTSEVAKKPPGKRGRKRKVAKTQESNENSNMSSLNENADIENAEDDQKANSEEIIDATEINMDTECVAQGAKSPLKPELADDKTSSSNSNDVGASGRLSSTPSKESCDDASKESTEESQGPTVEKIQRTTPPREVVSFPPLLRLDTNPLHWSVEDVIRFMKETDCAQLARLLKDQDIDGQALLLLTLPTVQEHLELQLGPAMKLCHQVERIKLAFYSQFAK